MTATVNRDTVFALSPTYRLQWEEAQNCNVLLYPEGMVTLNQSAGEILKLCDGATTVAALVAALEEKFGASGIEPDVVQFLETAVENGWIRAV